MAVTPNTATNVSVGKPKAEGAVFFAPAATTLPSDATTALAAGFVNAGYVSEDGMTNSISSDFESIKEWGGAEVLTMQTSREETFAFKLIETNADVLKQVFGADNVTVTGDAIVVTHTSADSAPFVLVFEILLTGGRVKRIVVPNAKITEMGDIVYAAGEPIGYELTVSALPDTSSNTAYEYIATVVAGE